MKKKSNILLAAGALAFVIGVGIVLGTLRGHGDAAASDEVASTVLVAKEPIPPGTTGDDAIARGLVVAGDVDVADRATGALTTTDQLVGHVLDLALAPGQQVTTAALRPPTLRASAITIPAGKQGVAVELPFVPAGGGYIGTGDHVNVYGNVPQPDGTSVAQLVLQGVEVLDVSTEVAPRVTGGEERPTASAITYLLALDLDEAQRVIDIAANAQLWLALVP